MIFPEGFTVAEMADRVDAVREDRDPQAWRHAACCAATATCAPPRAAVPPKPFLADWKRGKIEGFLFPSSYGFTQMTSAREPRAPPARRVPAARSRRSTSRYARSKNLTPYDILKIASMIEKEVGRRRSERRLVAARHLQPPKARMPLQIDATVRYGLDIPADRVAHEGGALELRKPNPYNSRDHPRAAADAASRRQPRGPLARRSRCRRADPVREVSRFTSR